MNELFTAENAEFAEKHGCKFPKEIPGQVFTCYECGVIWQFDEVSEEWESVGNVELDEAATSALSAFSAVRP